MCVCRCASQALLSRDPSADHARTPGSDEFDAALQRFLGSGGYYIPSLPQPRSAKEALREAFRSPSGARDVDAGFEAMRLLQARLHCVAWLLYALLA